ncbi:sulfotransferase 1E1-like [Ptychodera flava]|uniref:sulfotransferase 1E1-like n=1 Tax=Ptychodera flava TaxID=63121 RepID=UPI00396AAD40
MAGQGGCFTLNGFVFLPYFDRQKLEDQVVNTFEFRRHDVVVSGFPKSGNTWLVEVLKSMYDDWGLARLGCAAEASIIEEHVYFKIRPGIRQVVVDTIKCEDLPSPRLLRTHLPASMFPLHLIKEQGAKVIHVSRNPKDVCVSTYHFLKSFAHGALSSGDFDQTVQDFLEDRIPYSPWLKYVSDWSEKGVDDNVLHVTYEEMNENLPAVIQKIATFLQRPLSDDNVERVVAATTVDAMRNRLSEMLIIDQELIPEGQNPFVRKGTVGDWKNYFTDVQNELFDAKIGKEVKDKNLKIPYQ